MSVQVPRDPSSGQDLTVLALREALAEPAGLDPRQAEIVELRDVGLTEDEMATVSSRSRSGVISRPPRSGWTAG
jgi:hypothetical protein